MLDAPGVFPALRAAVARGIIGQGRGKYKQGGRKGRRFQVSTLIPTKPVAPSTERRYANFIMQQQIKTDTPTSDLETRFRALADQWRWETGPLSSSSKMAAHPAYQEIIGMGPAAIPLVLRELQERCDHWFAALRALSGENPVPREFAGRVPKMRELWLEWGREKGYIS